MKGIVFGNLHSYRDLHLILNSKEIGTPSPKTELIDIPGGDGVLDFTEFFGEVKYNNRALSFEFSTIVPQSQFMDLFSTVQNALHGQKMMISLDDDPEWYYVGRITVSDWKAEKRIGKLTIDCDCEPFKYRLTSQAVNMSGSNLLNLDSGTATTDGAWTKTETGYSFTRGAEGGGSFVYFSIPVRKGQQYIFSADYTLSSRLLYVYKDKLYGALVAKSSSGEPCVFTAEETGVYVFGLYVSSNVNDGTFENVMVQEGASVGPYTAYDATEKEAVITFTNTRKAAVPTFYASGSLSVESASNFVTLSGVQTLPEFTFYRGDTTLTFKGYGVAVVQWREAGL